MAMKSALVLNNSLRELWMTNIINLIDDQYEVLRVGSGKLAIPVLDEENNEKWVTISVSVPKGSNDGEAYDGYGEAEAYTEAQVEKARKSAEREAEKVRKAQEREAKKAEREAKKAKAE